MTVHLVYSVLHTENPLHAITLTVRGMNSKYGRIGKYTAVFEGAEGDVGRVCMCAAEYCHRLTATR